MQAHLIASNPTEGATIPRQGGSKKQVLNDRELDAFLAVIKGDKIWHDFFYTDLTTGLRRGEICGLMWRDFDGKAGTLKVCRTLHSKKLGVFSLGDTKTGMGMRTIVLPQSTANLLRQRKKKSISQWIFPNPIKPELPVSPNSAYNHLKTLLKQAELPSIRFHDLRHTFATLSLQNGMDVKTLSAMLGHVSAATTLDIYTHITDDMRQSAAASIDRGIGKVEPKQDDPAAAPAQPEKPRMTDFKPYRGSMRKPGTGCISEINDHLFEGRYSPMWPDGKKHARNVYAKTRAECEEKLKKLIVQMKKEIEAGKAGKNPDNIPDGISKKKKSIAAYLCANPQVTNKALIARESGASRWTVVKYYDEIRRIMAVG